MTADVEIPSIASPVKKGMPSPVKKVAKPKPRGGPSKAKPNKPKRPSNHPKVKDMVVSAIKALKERKGASYPAIKKYIQANYNDINMVKLQLHVKKALKSGLADDVLVQSAGNGVNGRFKIAKPNKKGETKKPGAKNTVKAKKNKPTGDQKKTKKQVAEKKKTTAEKKTIEGAGDAAKAKPTRKAAPKKKTTKNAGAAKKEKPAAKKPAARKGKK